LRVASLVARFKKITTNSALAQPKLLTIGRHLYIFPALKLH
jgi:hypothetical protein